MAIVFKNNASTTLSAALSSSATSITVADATKLPSITGDEYFFCTIDDGSNIEIVKVTGVSSNTLTIVRAQDDTTAQTFSSGDTIEQRLTAAVLETFPQLDAGEITATEFIGDLRGAVIFNAQAGEAIDKGEVVYVSGISGNTPIVALADADDSSKMPAFGLALESATLNNSLAIVTFGTISGVDTDTPGFSLGDTLYVSTTPGALTNSPPAGESAQIQNIGKVQRSHASAGSIKVGGAGRSNATPNLDDGKIFIGNASNQSSTATLDTSIVVENTNLYYTTARANSAIDARVTNTFINNLTGVVADTATALATARTISLSGDIAGSASFDGTSDITITSTIQPNSIALGTDTVGNYVQTITGTANKVSVSGSGSESADITLSLPDDVQIADSLTVAGNLTVNGTLTSLDTTNLDIEDNLFQLNAGLTGSPVNDSGMLINRGNQNNGIFMWDESVDKFTLGLTTADGTSTGNITLSSLGTLVANVEGNLTGNVTGQVSDISNFTTANLTENTNLYYTDARVQAVSINNVVEDTTPQLGGDLASNGNMIRFGDSSSATDDRLKFGVSNDLQIYHDGSNSYIDEVGTGNLHIRGSNQLLLQNNDGTKNFVVGNNADGWVKLYHDNSVKLETTSTGIDVTGNLKTSSTINVNSPSGYGNIELGGPSGAYVDFKTPFNDDHDARIIYNGSILQISTAVDNPILVKHNNSEKLRTLSTGIDITGTLVADSLTVDTSTLVVDATNNRVGIGTSSPSANLEIAGAKTQVAGIPTNNIYVTDSTSLAANTGGGIAFQGVYQTGGAITAFASIEAMKETATHNQYGGALVLKTRQDQGSMNEGMRLTSTNRVGIGIASDINANLHVGSSNATGDATNPAIQIGGSSAANNYRLGFYTSTEGGVIENKNGDDGIQFRVKTAGEAMRIDGGTGNVGISTSAPSYKLDVDGDINIGDGSLLLETTSSGFPSTGLVHFSNNFLYQRGGSAGMIFSTAGGTTEALRFNSSGQVIINGSAPLGSATLTVDSDSAAIAVFDGSSASGGYLQFRNNNTAKGVLGFGSNAGASSVNNMILGTNTGSLQINIPETAGAAIKLEFGNNDNTTRRTVQAYKDNFEPAAADTGVISLGSPTSKWKDLYLSGGAYLGGTAAGNKLEDYEEGTWTPSITFGLSSTGITHNVQNGKYVKIGSAVYVSCHCSLSSKGTAGGVADINGLPFTINQQAFGAFQPMGDRQGLSTAGVPVNLYLAAGNAYARLYKNGFTGTGNSTVTNVHFTNTTDIDVNFVYYTDS